MENNDGAFVAKRDIRLQYSGFAIFGAKLLSVATGFIFQFILARALTAKPATSGQYGIWFNINDVLAYFTLLVGVVPFWVMRYVTRGKEASVKTGLATNMIIAAIGTVSYLALAPFILAALGITTNFLPLYLVASIQIAEAYGIGVFEACLQAYRPQAVGYGLLFQQVSKVVLGYILIIQFGQPLLGAVASTIVAFGIQAIYYFTIFADEMKQHIQWGYVKDWLKGSIASIYNVVGNQIAAFVFIMLLWYGTDMGRGLYGAAAQIANIIAYSSFLAFALYPKLLAEKKREDVTVSLKMVLMFAVPMTVGAILLADSYITLLSPTFGDAYIVLVVLAADTFVSVTSSVFGSVLFGVETVDQQVMSFRRLVRSKLFLAFSLPYLHSAMALPTTYYVLTTYAFGQPVQAALAVSVINAVARFVTFIILYAIVRKMIKIDIPWRSISKYVLASAVMGAVMFLLPHPNKISSTLIVTAVGSVVYLGVLVAIDKEARALPKAILQEIRGKKSVSP
jgi:O-antigen/teichoic acid export membrane protein